MSRHRQSWRAFVHRTLRFSDYEHLYHGVCFINNSGVVDFACGCFQDGLVAIDNSEEPLDTHQFSDVFDRLIRKALLESRDARGKEGAVYDAALSVIPSLHLGAVKFQIVSASFISISAIASAKRYGLVARRLAFGLLIVVFRYPHALEDVHSIMEDCCAALG